MIESDKIIQNIIFTIFSDTVIKVSLIISFLKTRILPPFYQLFPLYICTSGKTELTLVTWAFMMTWRLGRFMAGRRKARAVLHLSPPMTFSCVGQYPM